MRVLAPLLPGSLVKLARERSVSFELFAQSGWGWKEEERGNLAGLEVEDNVK